VLWEVVEQVSDAPPCCFVCSFGGFAHEVFELGEYLLDGVQIGTVGRQEQQVCADAPDCVANGGALVAGEIVHDHNVACREGRDEALFDITLEAVAIDRLIQNAQCIDPVSPRSRPKPDVPCLRWFPDSGRGSLAYMVGGVKNKK
jgi:hypothetical protein